MSSLYETDIINSATPLETQLAGVHPRLYTTDAGIAAVRAKLKQEPWASFLRRIEAMARGTAQRDVALGFTGDVRGVGCGLAHLAAAYRMTDNTAYLDSARAHLAAMADVEDWTHSLIYGHWAHGFAVAYDWLYHELNEDLRETVRRTLLQRTELVYQHWCDFSDAYPTGYAWNHMAVVHGGMMAAGCALWGDIEGVGKVLRLTTEKLRLMAGALGVDGASAEGLAYGQYHNAFLFQSLTLARDLLGEDFISDTAFLRNYPQFMLHSTLPRGAWTPGGAFMILGDNNGHHWYGPDTQLRFAARHFKDGQAQWLADTAAAADICADSQCFLNLIWHDESVTPLPPDGSPTLHHCADKDIVFMRDSWESQSNTMALKCGPNSGHHARGYRQNIGGGHMHPDAGHVILHGAGDWLLVDDGYTQKFTSYQNTVLVNGIGQTGEGGEWFEDLEMRRGKPEGRILLAQPGADIDIAIGDAAPAYRPEARLRRFLRHLLYLKPDVWVLVDELDAEEASTFELRFHTPRACIQAGDAAWAMRMDKGALRLHYFATTPATARAFVDPIQGVGANHPSYDLDTLAITNATPQRSAVFLTVLHAHPAATEPSVSAQFDTTDGALVLTLDCNGTPKPIALHLGQSDPSTPIFTLPQ
jgi:hypothetical protein